MKGRKRKVCSKKVAATQGPETLENGMGTGYGGMSISALYSIVSLTEEARGCDRILGVALGGGPLLLEWPQNAGGRERDRIDRARQDAEVDTRAVPGRTVLIHLPRGFVFQFLLLSLSQKRLDDEERVH